MKEKVLQAKQATVKEIQEKIQKSQAIILVDYRGLNVEQVTELRAKYRESGVDYKVYKNTMMWRAFEAEGLTEMEEFMNGPNAVAFGFDDPVAVAKITSEFAKEHEQLEIRAGIVDGKLVSLDEIKALAELPSKETLIARALAGFNSPLQGFVNVLNGNIRGLAVALNAIKEKKEQEA